MGRTKPMTTWTVIAILSVLVQSPAAKPRIVMDSERISLSSAEATLAFSGFSRVDWIEVVRAGRQEETSIGVSSVTIRNRVVQHRQKSYTVQARTVGRTAALTFRPADVRQDCVIVVTIPQGLRVTITMDGQPVPTTNFQGALLMHDGRVDRGPHANALNALYELAEKGELVVPVIPPANPEARVIHREQPDLTAAELQSLRKLSTGGPLILMFEATVTATGQVIEVRQTSQLTVRLPTNILRKAEEAAMRYSYEPYVIDGAAQAFTTTIALELPR